MHRAILWLLATTSAAAFCATAAQAQTAQAQTAQAQTKSATVEELVITGTRIQSSGFEAPTPVTVVSSEQLRLAQPSGISAGLNQLPQFLGSQSPRQTQATVLNQPKGNILNLRGVGSLRTLILLDGTRVPPTTADGQVDVNLMPELLVSRVDIVTGGVSAVYGSDAVAGVVNYILDKQFTGIRGVVQGGLSDQKDAGSYRVGVALGHGFEDDRGHVLLSYDRNYQDGINRGERPLGPQHWFTAPRIRPGTVLPNGAVAGAPGSLTNPMAFIPNVIGTTATLGGFISAGVPSLVGLEFDPSGNTVRRDPGQFAGASGQIGGGDGVNGIPDNRTLIPNTWTDNGFGRLSFDLTDDLNIFGEVNASRSVAKYGSAINFGSQPIFSGNAFLPASAQAAIDAAGGTSAATQAVCAFSGVPAAICIQRIPGLDIGLPHQDETVKTLSFKTGVIGSVGGWKYDLTYVHGRVEEHAVEHDEWNLQHLFAALDAVRDPATGNIVCRVTLTNPGRYPGCVPANLFGEGRLSAAARAYALGDSIFDIENTTNDVVASISGNPFSTWAGPVGMAFSAEYRDAHLVETSNSNPAIPVDTVGIRGLSPTTGLFPITVVGAADGRNNVKEASVEVEVPLAKDMAFAHALSVTGAARYTDYSTSGGVWTWKVGGTWEPIEEVRLRVTRSRDIRAPTLFDLFAGPTAQFSAVLDVHCNCQRSSGVLVRGGGNPDLMPEIADTFTAGVVFQPQWLSGFTASADYYNLEINNAIQALSATQVIQECENSNGVGPACAGIVRPTPFSDRSPASAATEIFAGKINAARLATSGIDFEVAYVMPMSTVRDDLGGQVTFRLLANYVHKFDSQAFTSAPLISVVGFTDAPSAFSPVPEWRMVLSGNYVNGPLSLFYQERMIGSIHTGRTNIYEVASLPTVWYGDFTATYTVPTMGGTVDFFATINNVFDQDPPIFPTALVPGVSYPTIMSLYDVIGRYYTVGAKLRF